MNQQPPTIINVNGRYWVNRPDGQMTISEAMRALAQQGILSNLEKGRKYWLSHSVFMKVYGELGVNVSTHTMRENGNGWHDLAKYNVQTGERIQSQVCQTDYATGIHRQAFI